MVINKKINYSDPAIKIRIIKALADVKPFGMYKHFDMIRVLRMMKRPNVITNESIWKFLNENFDEEKYTKAEDDERISFDDIFCE